jgi:hypothetical protein
MATKKRKKAVKPVKAKKPTTSEQLETLKALVRAFLCNLRYRSAEMEMVFQVAPADANGKTSILKTESIHNALLTAQGLNKTATIIARGTTTKDAAVVIQLVKPLDTTELEALTGSYSRTYSFGSPFLRKA